LLDGGPRVITDGLGNLTSRRDFLPFGEDIGRARAGRTNIVTSSLENKVYFYSGGGVYATFPLDDFKKVRNQ